MDVKEAKVEAIKEFTKEQMERAKERIKTKLRELHNAEKVVKNIKRELEDLEDELSTEDV